MTNKNLTISLSDEDQMKLDYLVEFFDKKSITTVFKSDVLKFLITRAYEFSTSPDSEKILEFYRHLGLEVSIDKTEDFLNKLREEQE